MKTMLLAAAAALSLGVSSAYAGESGAQSGGYVYPGYQFPAQNAPSVPTTAPNGQVVHTFVTQSSHGTWLFAPNANQGANS
jgi:hypothetical protein